MSDRMRTYVVDRAGLRNKFHAIVQECVMDETTHETSRGCRSDYVERLLDEAKAYMREADELHAKANIHLRYAVMDNEDMRAQLGQDPSFEWWTGPYLLHRNWERCLDGETWRRDYDAELHHRARIRPANACFRAEVRRGGVLLGFLWHSNLDTLKGLADDVVAMVAS